MIGIIGAMNEEISVILNELKNIEEIYKYNIKFYKGFYKNKEIVVVESGVGMVNASTIATLLISIFDIELLLFSGVAGGLKEGIKVGDVVIGTSFVEYMYDLSKIDNKYVQGQIAGTKKRDISACDKLLNFVKKLNLENIYYGRIISGDTFVADMKIKEELIKEFNPFAVDMESAAVAHTCVKLGIDYLIIRSISDAYKGTYVEYEKFLNYACNNSKNIIFNILERLIK